jgi:hypothetical protein
MTLITSTLLGTATGTSAPVRFRLTRPEFKTMIAASVTGTINFTVQASIAPSEQSGGVPSNSAPWFALNDFTALTADSYALYDMPLSAIRLVVNSVSGGSVTVSTTEVA